MTTTTTDVTYMPAFGCPGYRVGDDGTVWSSKAKGKNCMGRVRWKDGKVDWRKLKPATDRGGYARVCICRYGQSKWTSVNRLVLLSFRGECPAGMESRHLNGNPGDNRLGNLEWGTVTENMQDRDKHGRGHRGDRHFWTKLTKEQVGEIRRRVEAGEKRKDLAEEYGVAYPTIISIVNRQSWRWLR